MGFFTIAGAVLALAGIVILSQQHAEATSTASTLGTAAASMAVRSLLSARTADAWPEYRYNVPNGKFSGDPYYGHTANAFLGTSPKNGGDQFGHNGYGRDYNAYGNSWNRFLCASDSDLDGSTNALELGDPCCGWGIANGSTTGFSASDIGNPGLASHGTSRVAPLSCHDPRLGDSCAAFGWSVANTVTGTAPSSQTEGLSVVHIDSSGNQDSFIVLGLDVVGAGSLEARTWSLDVDRVTGTAAWTLLHNTSDASSNSMAGIVGQFTAATYDSDNGRVVAFGGLAADGSALGVTGVYDISGNTWSALSIKSPSARYKASHGVLDTSFLVMGGRQQGGIAFHDVWAFDTVANVWEQKARYAPGSITADLDPAAVLPWSRQVLYSSPSLQQQWLWNFDDDSWERTFFGLLPAHRGASLVGTAGAVVSIGGAALHGADVHVNDSLVWETSNHSIREDGVPAWWSASNSRWEMRFGDAHSFTNRSDMAVTHITNSGESLAAGARFVAIGGVDTNGLTQDLNGDGLVDVAILRADATHGPSECHYAPPSNGAPTNSSLSGLLIRGYDAAALLQDEDGNYRASLAWTLFSDGTGARFALRAETAGYISLAFVDAAWPVTEPAEYGTNPYNGKMYGADGVIGWFDRWDAGHVESYLMPSYLPEDILANKKGGHYIFEPSISYEDGFMTLEFDRRFNMDATADVDINATGSWIMWAFAEEGLFPDGEAEGDTMVIHTERHEAFIQWANIDAYQTAHAVSRAEERCSSALDDVLAAELGAPAGSSVTNCTGLRAGDTCTLQCASGAATGVAICDVDESGSANWWVDPYFFCDATSPVPTSCPSDSSSLPVYDHAQWVCDPSASTCRSLCDAGYRGSAALHPLYNDAFPGEPDDHSINALAHCSNGGDWILLDEVSANCTVDESVCHERPPSVDGAFWANCEGSAAGDSCQAYCLPGFTYSSDALFGEASTCNGTTGTWSEVQLQCHIDESYCSPTLSNADLGITANFYNYSVDDSGDHVVVCPSRSVHADCRVHCASGYLYEEAYAVCAPDYGATTAASEQYRFPASGVWLLPENPSEIECLPPLAQNELHVTNLSNYFTISGSGYRVLGLSWDFIPGDDDHADGYLDVAIRTRQDGGYLGIAFGEEPELMIPGDGTWAWVDDEGDSNMVVYRMESYISSYIETAALDEEEYIVDGSVTREDGLQTVRWKLRLNHTGPEGTWVPIQYNDLTHFQWALSDLEGVEMHTEWGALDMNFSADYSNLVSAPHDELESVAVEYIFVTFGIYILLLVIPAVIACAAPDKLRCCNNSLGQLRCCRGAKGQQFCWSNSWLASASWPDWLRQVTVDFVQVALNWSLFVWGFFVLTIGLLLAFFFAAAMTGVEPARVTGWMSVMAFALTLFPISRDSFVLKLFRIPFDRAIAHHRALGRVFFAAQFAHLGVVVRDWGLEVSTVNEAFGAGNVIPVWGWVAFAMSMAIMILSFEPVRRKAFEVFLYTHIIFFFLQLWFTAVHVNVMPFLPLFELDQKFDNTPTESYLGLYIGLGIPVVGYVIDRIVRGVKADGCCGKKAGYTVVRASVHKAGENGEEIVHLVVKQPHARSATNKVGPPGSAHVGKPRIMYHTGQYCFVSFPEISTVESHPYTISSVPGSTGSDTDYNLGFHIKALGDHSKKLADLVRRKGASPELIDVRIQGPYGNVSFNPFKYENMILVAGGIGVTPLIGLVEDALRRRADGEKRNVLLIWATRSAHEANMFNKVLAQTSNASQNPGAVIETRVFITSKQPTNNEKSPVDEPSTTNDKSLETHPGWASKRNVDTEHEQPKTDEDRESKQGAPSASKLDPEAGEPSGVDATSVASGRPNIDAEIESFLAKHATKSDTSATPSCSGSFKYNPDASCVLACGPWKMIVSTQVAAHRRAFIFHKEVFDL